MENESGDEILALYHLPEDISTMNDLSQRYGDKVQELLDAAATIDADVSAGIRPEWNAGVQE
jgi:hypothetical protein